MKRLNLVLSNNALLLGTLFILILSMSCSSKKSTESTKSAEDYRCKVDQTILSMDMNGASLQYKVSYEIVSKKDLNRSEFEGLKSNTKFFLSEALSNFTYEECALKRDSVNAIIINEISKESKTSNTSLESFVIEDVAIPKIIKEHCVTRNEEYENVSSI